MRDAAYEGIVGHQTRSEYAKVAHTKWLEHVVHRLECSKFLEN